MTIILLSNSEDPHVDAVAAVLGARGADAVRLDTDRRAGTIRLEMLHDRRSTTRIHVDGRLLHGEDVRWVWNRRPTTPSVSSRLSGNAARFAEAESAAGLHGLLRSLGTRWLNHPDRNRAASLKPVQLGDAAALGFEVPRTCITDDPETARGFATEVGGTVIAKLVSPGPPRGGITDPYNVFASLVTADDLTDVEAVAACPVIYQEPIAKRVELRVTVVGERVLACEIDSQAVAGAALDWRRELAHRIPHRSVDLADDVAARCVALCRLYGLEFGALDLIVTPEGTVVFLELNPNGQWLWVQELAGLPIAESIADRLMSDE